MYVYVYYLSTCTDRTRVYTVTHLQTHIYTHAHISIIDWHLQSNIG